MDAKALDAELARLVAVADRVRANLLEMELDPGRQLIATSSLKGETAARWATANGVLNRLWVWLELLDRVLATARAERGTRPRPPAARVARVAELLRGPSLEAPGAEVPVDERDLMGDSRVVVRCSPDELLARMAADFEAARACVGEIGAVWDELGSRLDAIRASLVACQAAEAALTGRQRDRLAALERDAAGASTLLMSDPLAVAPDALDALAASAAELDAQVRAFGELERAGADRLLAARRLLGQVRAAHQESLAAYEEARVKISGIELPEPPADPDGVLDAELRDVSGMADRRAWGDANEALAEWTARATAVRDELEQIAAANRAPIAARDELRGLLDAYRSKARRIGAIEDPELAGLFERAHDALYTAPTDVDHAAGLVRDCQRALPERAPSAGGPR